MSIKNILILTVLMSFGGYSTIQAESLRGMEIPNLNITAVQMRGQWYGLISSNGNENISCSTMALELKSERSFRMNYTFYETGKEPYSLVFNCTLAENSNIIVCDKGVAGEMIAVIFDIQYDSYMAMYTTSTIEKAGSGNDGYVFIMGHGKTLPDGTLAKIEKSKFYLEGMKPGVELHTKRTDGCP